ncbi:MAG: hypothetical protein A3A96_00785 [Candidatus Zambryskibacteria bacterium RIFCSPLOWO2_01_FULL_39_39]|uniref:Methyltransferase type 11 domain-containing protein n=1 Tax=Candidatus Zambryskibacteria bacterium RIFCSPLOWO2_01_FULL_39_39 TaxID=1802758 RepID=A0A1G2TYF9_9BACT|nr:MAG: hypothetical protein A3B88_00590 [Candidatus Zambryskibacteria bacterium RIFCSPHIGHO2_02_FULL_39_19]OHB02203.1 MAG: hypothetical protein A3A96_00785 [Candidatus Zambryskibacteria bacterium RIFCSPLOWO2_01_FULL_39_39]
MIAPECRRAEDIFWGDPHNIAWFREEPVPPYWDEFFRKADRTAVNRVLDLGCGAGRVAKMLAGYSYDFRACDFNPEMARETVMRLAGKQSIADQVTRVSQASMIALPYPDGYFDAVVSNGVYHNAWSREDLGKALGETARILRSRGYLCFNLFTSGFVASDLKPVANMGDLYVTAEGLRMVLVSKEDFLEMAGQNNLHVEGEITEYLREVTTGRRYVVRGVLRTD